jgi:hypothetical protein
MGDEAHAERLPPASPASDADAPASREHLIRKRAHEIWIEEGKPEGQALDHWLRARWELEDAPDAQVEVERLARELARPAKKD